MASVLERLNPILETMLGIVVPRFAERVFMGMLGTFSQAVGAVLELPRFRPEHKQLLLQDVEQLCVFFRHGGVLEEQVIRYSVTPLYSLIDEACVPSSGLHAVTHHVL